MNLPSKPLPPDPADCCGGGCTHCVWDAYDDALARWQAAHANRDVQPTPTDEAGN